MPAASANSIKAGSATVIAMCVLLAENAGAGQVLLPPAGPFTPAFEEASMHSHSTTPPTDRQLKRERLRELVCRMGPDAKPPEIREAAYREGLGQLSGPMLIKVRNDLWPDRKKKTGGRPAGLPDAPLVCKLPAGSIFACPACESPRTRIRAVYRLAAGGIRRRHHCQACGHTYLTVRDDNTFFGGRAVRRIRAEATTHKTCTGCKRMLPLDEFSRKASFGPDALFRRPRCRRCANDQRRAAYGPKSIFAIYGITADDYARLLAEQGGTCAICRRPETRRKASRLYPLAIDHCHATGHVRGLLCNRCNTAIGLLQEDPALFAAAVDYVLRHRGADEDFAI